MQHEEVAGALQDLDILSCGHPEGFGLPLAEAIACGCLVVGYHGLAGRDFAIPHMKVVEFEICWATRRRGAGTGPV